MRLALSLSLGCRVRVPAWGCFSVEVVSRSFVVCCRPLLVLLGIGVCESHTRTTRRATTSLHGRGWKAEDFISHVSTLVGSRKA